MTLRATAIVRRPAVKPERVADTLTLDHEARHRRRMALTADGGLAFLLDLERASVMEDGDALKLDDGRLVRVRAAPERLLAVTTENPLRLMRIAWHIGNRHVAAEIAEGAIYIAYDHVLLEMIRGLGAHVETVERPFRPERGAYDEGHDHGSGAHDACGHDHGHAHGHDHGSHAHGHDAHAHDHAGHPHAGHDHGAPAHAHRDHAETGHRHG